MCGFSGFTSPNSKNEDKVLLKKMMHPINHRGPDESSIYINDKVALGHYRLSIIDISKKRFCMATVDVQINL